MKKNKPFLLILIAGFALLLSADAMAQGQGRGWGRWAQPDHQYNVNTVETVEGVVDEVTYVSPTRGRGPGPGVHFTLKKGSEVLEVVLGPVTYLNEQAEPFEKGDKVTVIGSRITLDDKPALIAKTLTFGDKTIALRDDNGLPKWRGTQQGGGMGQGMRQGQGMSQGMGRGMGRGRGMGQGAGRGGCRCCASSTN